MGTFEVVPCPPNVRPIGSKLVLKIKLDNNGALERFKARLCARGDRQKEGDDFTHTFAPVAPWTVIRTVLALCVQQGWHLHCTDFTQAYLNGKLDCSIYMTPPASANVPPGHVYHILKGLYGLKQAGRIWNQHLDRLLRQIGLMPLRSAPCVYMRGSGATQIIAVVYVDDILLTSPSLEEITRVKSAMADVWKLEDKGEATRFCGLQLDYDRMKRTLHIHLKQYIRKLLDDFDITATSRVPLSQLPEPSLTQLPADLCKTYTNLAGRLAWISDHGRPDITFAARTLACRMSKPDASHLAAARQVAAYLNNTQHLALCFRSDAKNAVAAEDLQGYTDANWASNPHNGRRSTSGSVCLYRGCLVGWKSQVQKSVALSAVEAELIAGSEACRELEFLRHVLRELGFLVTANLHTDSLGCIQVSKDPAQHWRLKHVDIKYHYLRERVQSTELVISHVPTTNNPADVFTKPVGKNILREHWPALGLVSWL